MIKTSSKKLDIIINYLCLEVKESRSTTFNPRTSLTEERKAKLNFFWSVCELTHAIGAVYTPKTTPNLSELDWFL